MWLCVRARSRARMHGCVLNVIVIVQCGGFYGQDSHWAYGGMRRPRDRWKQKESKRIMRKQRCIDKEDQTGSDAHL